MWLAVLLVIPSLLNGSSFETILSLSSSQDLAQLTQASSNGDFIFSGRTLSSTR